MPSENFALCSIKKGQLEDLQNYLNQRMIGTINTADGSTLIDNLITSHQVDYMSSAVIIRAGTFENDQEHIGSLLHFRNPPTPPLRVRARAAVKR